MTIRNNIMSNQYINCLILISSAYLLDSTLTFFFNVRIHPRCLRGEKGYSHWLIGSPDLINQDGPFYYTYLLNWVSTFKQGMQTDSGNCITWAMYYKNSFSQHESQNHSYYTTTVTTCDSVHTLSGWGKKTVAGFLLGLCVLGADWPFHQ